jgi:hypothetical protein
MNLPFHAMSVAGLVADHIESDSAITCLASWDGIHGGAPRVGTAIMCGVRFRSPEGSFF